MSDLPVKKTLPMGPARGTLPMNKAADPAPIDPAVAADRARPGGVPMDERKTIPRSATPGKIDVAKADQRRSKTAKITRRPNEYIPSDDSDVLGPSPEKLAAGRALEQSLFSDSPGKPGEFVVGQGVRRDPLPVSVRTGPDRTLIYGAMVFACVVALAATVAFAIGRSRATPAPTVSPSAPKQEAPKQEAGAATAPIKVDGLGPDPVSSSPAKASPPAGATQPAPSPAPPKAAKPPRDKDGLIFD